MLTSSNLENIRCSYCESKEYVKNGKSKDNQRYKCKNCKTTFIVKEEIKQDESILNLTRKALHLYLEGYSLELIGEILNVHKSKINRWMNRLGKGVLELRTKPRYIPYVMDIKEYIKWQSTKADQDKKITYLSILLTNAPKTAFGRIVSTETQIVTENSELKGVQNMTKHI